MATNNPYDSLVPEAPQGNTLPDLIPDHNDLQRQGLQQSMFVAGQTDPDKAADAINLATKYNVDPMFAHDNLDALKKSSAGSHLDYDNLIENYPGTTNFMQKPENAAIAHDDTDNLNRIDHGTQIISKKNGFLDDEKMAVTSGFNDLQRAVISLGVAHGYLDKDDAAANLESLKRQSDYLDTLKPDYLKAFETAMADNKKDLGKAFDQLSAGYDEAKNQSLTQAMKDFGEGSVASVGALLDFAKTMALSPRASLYTATQSTIPFIPMIALGSLASIVAPAVVGGSAAAGTVGSIAGSFMGGAPIFVGQKFNQLMEQKGLDPDHPEDMREAFSDPELMSQFRDHADKYGLTFGSLAALFGGLGGVFAKEGVSVAEPGLAASLGRGAEGAARFGAGSALQAGGLATSQAAGEVAGGEKPDIASALQNAVMMLGQGAAIEAIAHGRSALHPRETIIPSEHDIMEPAPTPYTPAEPIDIQPEQKLLTTSKREQYSSNPVEAIQQVANDTHTAVHALQGLQALDEMGSAVKESKMAKRVPDKIEELVQASGGQGNVFFQTSDFDKYFTDKGLSPAKAAAQIVGDSGEAYQTAKETGQDMAIPLAKYISNVAPSEHYDALLNYVKTAPNGMKFEDAKTHMDSVSDTVKAISSEASKPVDEAAQISSQAYDQLVSAGRSPEEAKAASQIIESRLNARSSITGISPRDYFNKYGFEITGEKGDTLAELPKTVLNQGEVPEKLFQGPNDEGTRGSIEFGPYKALITLGQKADASTFIHESFHLWTKEFMDDFNHLKNQETLTARQKQFMTDGQSILDYVGAKSFDDLSTEQWEKIAESGEEYLREGKAPTAELQGAFTRFKTWISYLYRALKNNRIQLSDSIRGVFDRLLSSEDEASREEVNPLFKDTAASGMTDARAAQYQALQSDLRQHSENLLRESLMKDLEKRQSKDYKAERAKIREHVVDTINNDPTYRALSVLKDGVLPDGSELPEGTFPIKLSKESIIEEYGPEYVSNLPKGIFDKESGLPADMVAESFGFSSGDDLLHSLANAPTKSSAIEAMTDEGMRELHPDLLEQPQLSDEAVKAAHNDKKSQMLRMELEHLASDRLPEFKNAIRQISRRVPTDLEVRTKAQNILNKIPINQISAYTFELAERKASREAGSALAKGDLEGAYQAKNRELLNHELYKAAVEAKETVEKSTDLFKRVSQSDEDLAKGRDTDLINASRALLAQYGLGRTKKTPTEYLENIRKYDPDKFATLSDLIGTVSQTQKDYRNLSLEDFMNLKHSFDALWSLSKSENQIKVDGKMIDKQIAIDGIKSDLQKYKDFKGIKEAAPSNRSKTDIEKRRMDLAAAKASGRIAEHLIDQWSLGEIDSSLRKYIFNVANSGAEKYHNERVTLFKKLDALIDPIRETIKMKKIEVPEINYTFGTKAELLGALLHTGNESNLSKLLRGRGWGEYDEENNLNRSRWDAAVSRLQNEGVLHPSDYDFAQGVWDLFEGLKPQAQGAHKEMLGYYFNEITAQPFEALGKEYRGGYMPAKVDPYENSDAQVREEKAAFEKIENTWAFPTTGRGFTKSRVDAYAAPLQISLNNLHGAMDWELRFIHIEPRVKEVAKLLWDKDLRAEINAVHPHAVKEVLVPWLQRTANQMVTFPTANKFIDSAARYLKASTQMQYLAFNISSAAKRITGVFPATLKVPVSDLRNGFISFAMSPGNTTRMIQEKSDFMRVHTSDQLANIQESIRDATLNPSVFVKAQNVAKPYTSMLIKGVQHMVDMSVWHGAYNHALSEAPAEMAPEAREDRAIRSADSAVRMTQGSSFPEHVSRWATGTPAQNLFKMFVSHFNTIGNLLVSESNQSRTLKRTAYVWAAGFMGFAITGALIESALHGNADKKDNEAWTNYLLQKSIGGLLGVGTSFVPTAGPAVNSALQFLVNPKTNPADFHIELSPALSSLTSDVKGVSELKNAISKNKPLKGHEIQDIFTMLGQATGLPLGPASKPLSFLTDVKQNRVEKPTNPLELVRGLATGKAKLKK